MRNAMTVLAFIFLLGCTATNTENPPPAETAAAAISANAGTVSLEACLNDCNAKYDPPFVVYYACQTQCYSAEARQTGAAACEPTLAFQDGQDQLMYATCLRDANIHDAAACGRLTDINYKSTCLVDAAEAEGDSAPCERIDDATYRNLCVKEVAKRLANPGLCERITQGVMIEQCLREAQ